MFIILNLILFYYIVMNTIKHLFYQLEEKYKIGVKFYFKDLSQIEFNHEKVCGGCTLLIERLIKNKKERRITIYIDKKSHLIHSPEYILIHEYTHAILIYKCNNASHDVIFINLMKKLLKEFNIPDVV